MFKEFWVTYLLTYLLDWPVKNLCCFTHCIQPTVNETVFQLNCFRTSVSSSENVACIIYFSLLKSSRYPVGWIVLRGTLGDHVLEIQKKKFATDAAKKGAPHGSGGAWSDHDLIMIWITIYSWKKDISWSTWWSRDPDHDLIRIWITKTGLRDFRALMYTVDTNTIEKIII